MSSAPEYIRSGADAAAVFEELGLEHIGPDTDFRTLWRDPATDVTATGDGTSQIGPHQVVITGPGLLSVFCYRGGRLPARLVESAIAEARTEHEARQAAAGGA